MSASKRRATLRQSLGEDVPVSPALRESLSASVSVSPPLWFVVHTDPQDLTTFELKVYGGFRADEGEPFDPNVDVLFASADGTIENGDPINCTVHSSDEAVLATLPGEMRQLFDEITEGIVEAIEEL